MYATSKCKSSSQVRDPLRQRIDVHESKERYDRAEHSVKVDKQLSDANRKSILRFISDLQAEGIGQARSNQIPIHPT